jgi:UPF0042 nucleotide-binding protein
MSGAGKSTALKFLEDSEYFCVDNLPVMLIGKFAQISLDGMSSEITKIAIGIDIRSGLALDRMEKVLKEIDEFGIKYEILFLEASDDVLIKRYKETRRTHPLSGAEGRVEDGIALEREKLAFLKAKADYIIDTSQLLTRDLKQEIDRIFVNGKKFRNLYITILSFGFKYGIPADSDLVFDVRFLPNPYYVENLRPHTGNDADVIHYVMSYPQTQEFLDRLEGMIRFLIPNYVKEGKHQLVISVGCTGGRHRSVVLANAIYSRLAGNQEYGIRIEHRDLEKDPVRKGVQEEKDGCHFPET